MISRAIFSATNGFLKPRYINQQHFYCLSQHCRLFSTHQNDNAKGTRQGPIEYTVDESEIIGEEKLKAAQMSIAEKLKEIKQ